MKTLEEINQLIERLNSMSDEEKLALANDIIENPEAKEIASQNKTIDSLQSEVARLKEELQKYRPEVKSCPNCLSDDIQMFTSDLDRCKKCGQTF